MLLLTEEMTVMMLRIVASDSQKMPPVSFPAGVKVNIEVGYFELSGQAMG
jgi:hypothetical protein